MASESDQSKQYLLPPLSELLPRDTSAENDNNHTDSSESTRISSFWNPFDRSVSPDRDYIRYQPASATNENTSAQEEPQDHEEPQHRRQVSFGLGIANSFPQSPYQPPDDTDDGDLATKSLGRESSGPSPLQYQTSQTTLLPHSPAGNCPTHQGVVQKRLSWVPITIFVLAVYATIFSGIYLVLALVKPRYGKRIGEDGGLAPSTANLLSALFAKTIELAYVTVCVAFLGQVLSRRAITKGSRGISISDMSMRAWIMQPGSLIVHWETVRYSALTVLGMITLTATLVAMLYTTAAEALVSPKLRMGPVEPRMLSGNVSTEFANPYYLKARCSTPITAAVDPVYVGDTCLDMVLVGQAYHDYQAYIAEWGNWLRDGNLTSTNLRSRLAPTGSLYDNTTVTGSWIDVTNITEVSQKYGRMVNNITAAMPHGGIVAAATNPANGIRKPVEGTGEANFEIEASVPSPAVNVLCVGMTADELTPLVYNEWPYRPSFNPVTWDFKTYKNIPGDWYNRTVVDDIFGWAPEAGRFPPVFGKLPKAYNTIINSTGPWPTSSIYMLGAAPEESMTPPYVICSLKAKLSPVCSTKYSATASGGILRTNCENPSNPMQFNRRNQSAVDGEWDGNWKNVADEWARSMSLNSGITDGQASNARLLMQFIPTLDERTGAYALDPRLPSIGEALAVMVGNTLILSSMNSPFVQFFNYTKAAEPPYALLEPVQQYFEATVGARGYASGGTEEWQNLFYVILVFAFLTSAIILAFMLLEVRGRQITDFTEPQNLFALAMNSPASTQLKGACGAGPQGRQLSERFCVAMEEDDEHYYIRTKAEEHSDQPSMAPARSVVSLEVDDVAKPVSPAMAEYRRLSSKSSLLSRFY
ncbi:uncharacterized protein ACLA_093720 [Aspergillus clavatus NRRL 1]|uniref:Mcm2 3 5 family protein n=1 Tax=Aspergillus clavatus (strain ATCC 1007 / CBS 513.65 / DSM 816 / NCTC 3887 / NRRL 1 / QM 1276 / 107) TaxID=344612 RepID=A1CFM4_ASPCL|nr:uncharacterized protein ACLA_093720 [Aspergillus clavatus NRRL 1]EAW11673.1 conserved hypothetical protein [Aspergillus clavatus NRRL 1]